MNGELLKYFSGDEMAANVWQSKYALEGEVTPDDMHRRMAKEFARIEEKYKIVSGSKKFNDTNHLLSKYGQTIYKLDEDRIYNYFKDFKYIIPQGSIMAMLGNPTIGSLSNCFVIGQPLDSYGGIFHKEQEMVQLMKRRGGVGTDLSTLAPKGRPVNNAAKTSTGAVSFAHRFSNGTREVAQDGRRGALMVSMDIRHPDSLDFIKSKRDLTQLTGANISVKIGEDFMQAVEKDEDFILRFPCDIDIPFKVSTPYNELVSATTNPQVYVKRVKAREYWNEVIKSAHSSAEPGIIFEDNHINYSPDGVYDQYRGVTTNPCGEIFMQPYDACRLIVVNLHSFVDKPYTKDATFNMKKFYEVNYEAMRLADNIIDLELEHIERIIHKIEQDPEPFYIKETELNLWKKVYSTAKASRRAGLGFTALGDCLAALGLKYASEEGNVMVDKIMHTKMESELDCTIDLAVLRGPFEGWDDSKEYSNDFKAKGKNAFYTFIARNFTSQYERMRKYGRRNVSFSTVAPTGSVSILAQTTSGIEPLFLPFYMRRKKINPSDEGARIDFTDDNGDTWQEFPVLHEKFKDWCETYIKDKQNQYLEDTRGNEIPYIEDINDKEDLEYLFKESPWYGSTANEIDWVKRVELQSIVQKYISHSISSTINLPETVTEEEVSEIYLESWKQGLKGITVYRDGSRSGVLVTNKGTNKGTFEYRDAVKRPKDVVAEVFTTTSQGKKYNVFVGLVDGNPYEVFLTNHFTNEDRLILRKIKRGRYDLLRDGEVYSEDITTEMSEAEEAITRLVSTSLRHGSNIKFIVEQLGKTSSENMFSFTKSLARVLKKYIPEGAKSTVTCNDCESENVVFEEGCHKCLDCGSSACS